MIDNSKISHKNKSTIISFKIIIYVLKIISDCDKSGNFDSITSHYRSRRSTHSYPEDRPASRNSVHNSFGTSQFDIQSDAPAAVTGYQNIQSDKIHSTMDQLDNRMEGMENVIKKFDKMINKLNKRVRNIFFYCLLFSLFLLEKCHRVIKLMICHFHLQFPDLEIVIYM